MEWTQENTLHFIELYRRKEVLWNPGHPRYYNKISKNDAWNELGAEMNTTGDECKKKMMSLLSSLRREKGKMKRTRGTGTGELIICIN